MRIRALWAVAAAVLTLVPSVATAAASSGSGPPASHAVCKLEFSWSLRVATSMTPTSGRFTSTSGTFTCRGTVFGRSAVDRPGRLVASETYGPDTCLAGHGRGPFKATVNTATGPITVRGVFYERRVGATGATTGTLTARRRGAARFRGSYALLPTSGQNCFTTPVKSGTVSATVVLTG